MFQIKKINLIMLGISGLGLSACTSGAGGDANNAKTSATIKSFSAANWDLMAENVQRNHKNPQAFNYEDVATGNSYIGISYQDINDKPVVETKIPLPTNEINPPTAYAFAVDGTLVVGFADGYIYKYIADSNGKYNNLAPQMLVNGNSICVHDNASQTSNICNLPITSLSILPHDSDALKYIAIGTGIDKVTSTSKNFTTSVGYSAPFDPRSASLSYNLNWNNTTVTNSYGGQVYYYYAGTSNTKEQLIWSNTGNMGQSVAGLIAVPGDSGYDGVFNPYAFIVYQPNPVVSSFISSTVSIGIPFTPSALSDPFSFLQSLIPSISVSTISQTTSAGYDFGVVSLARGAGVSRLSCYIGASGSMEGCMNSEPGNFNNLISTALDLNHARMYLGLKDGTIKVWSFKGTLPAEDKSMLAATTDAENSTFFTLTSDLEGGRIPTVLKLDGKNLLVGWSKVNDQTSGHNEVLFYKDVANKSPDIRGEDGDLPVNGRVVYQAFTRHAGEIVAMDFNKYGNVGFAAVAINVPKSYSSGMGWDQGRSGAIQFAANVQYDDDTYDYSSSEWHDINLIPKPKNVKIGYTPPVDQYSQPSFLTLAYSTPNYIRDTTAEPLSPNWYPQYTSDDTLTIIRFNNYLLNTNISSANSIESKQFQLSKIVPKVTSCNIPMNFDNRTDMLGSTVYDFAVNSSSMGTIPGGGLEVNNFEKISFGESGDTNKIVLTPSTVVLSGGGLSAQYLMPNMILNNSVNKLNQEDVVYDGIATMKTKQSQRLSSVCK